MNLLFLIASLISIISSVMVITRRNAIHALLYLVVSLISIAMVIYTLGAPYAAILEIIIYAGAIVILFVFVVMMLNINRSIDEERSETKIKFWIIPLLLSLILCGIFIYSFLETETTKASIKVVGAKEVGISMFSTYLFIAELAGILLLIGIVGAYHLGRTPKRNLHRYNLNTESEEQKK